jgi:ATP-dependent Clp endopeptidase proteolytic subunit ClpP
VEDSHAEIFIYDEISYFGVIAQDIVQEMKDLDVSTITLHINSPGGFVFDGMAIYNLFKQHKAEVTVKIDGLAASIASVIAMAGDKIEIADNAQIMIHDPMTFIMGNSDELKREAEVLDNIKETIITTYKHHSSLEREELASLMSGEKWFLADEAIEAGLATSTFEQAAKAASLNRDLLTNFANIDPQFLDLIARKDQVEQPNLGTPLSLAKAKLAYYENK